MKIDQANRIRMFICGGAGLFLLVLALLYPVMCRAAEGGSGAYWPGFRSFLAGVVPSKPGFYLRNDFIVYSADIPKVVLNGLPVENASIDLVADIIEPGYVFPWHLFGANCAMLLTQPLIWDSLSGRIIGTDIEPSGSHFAPGDTALSPMYLGWHKGRLYYNVNIAIIIPNGDYDIHRVANTSRNYWTFDPEFGITYLDPKTGWDFSGALGYSFNTENTDTKYQSGQAIHLDYAVGRTLKNGIKPGIVGYVWLQTTPDKGSGALLGSFESRITGIGPALQWPTGKNSQLTFKYFHEFAAVNHLEGDQFVLSFRVAL